MNFDLSRLRDLRVQLHNESIQSNCRATAILANAMGAIESNPSDDNFLACNHKMTDALISRLENRQELIADLAMTSGNQSPFWCEFKSKVGPISTITTPWTVKGHDDTIFISRRFRDGMPDTAPYQMIWSLDGLRRGLPIDQLVTVQYVRTSMHRAVSDKVLDNVRRSGLAMAAIVLAAQAHLSRAAAHKAQMEAKIDELSLAPALDASRLVPTLTPVPPGIPCPALRPAVQGEALHSVEPAPAPAMYA